MHACGACNETRPTAKPSTRTSKQGRCGEKRNGLRCTYFRAAAPAAAPAPAAASAASAAPPSPASTAPAPAGALQAASEASSGLCVPGMTATKPQAGRNLEVTGRTKDRCWPRLLLIRKSTTIFLKRSRHAMEWQKTPTTPSLCLQHVANSKKGAYR